MEADHRFEWDLQLADPETPQRQVVARLRVRSPAVLEVRLGGERSPDGMGVEAVELRGIPPQTALRALDALRDELDAIAATEADASLPIRRSNVTPLPRRAGR